MLAILAALGSALLVAVASVLQHRAGSSGAGALRRVFRHPLWIIGSAAGVAGFGLHVLALSSGALTLVQPLLVTGLLFALPLSYALDHHAVLVADLGAAAAVVGGLAIFQLTARPTGGRSLADLPVLGWCVTVAVVLTWIGLVIASRRPRRRAAWLGLCAGALFGVVAALLKATVGISALHGAAAFSTWPPYGFAVLVTVAIVINQLAFNAGPLALSLPLITIIDPMVSVVIGRLAFNETLSSSAGLVAGQILGFLVMSAGVIVLARRTGQTPLAVTAPRPSTDEPDSAMLNRAQVPTRATPGPQNI
ncbi:MAG: DMT family transporter [Jatrophihabitans sp.]